MIDMINGLLHVIDHSHVHDVIVVFRKPIRFGGRFQIRDLRFQNLPCRAIHPQFDFFLVQLLRNRRQEGCGDGFVHQQCFHSVADGRALHLGVHYDCFCHFQIGIAIDKHMANALVMFDHGHLGTLRHRPNKALAPARHAQVNILSEGEQFLDRIAIGRRNDLNGVSGKSREMLLRRCDHGLGDDLVGMNRFLAPPQNGGVARLETKATGIRSHVWTRFINDHHDANWGGDFPEPKPIGTNSFIQNSAHWIRECGYFTEAFRHAGDALFIELEPVEHGRGKTTLRARRHIARIGRFDSLGVLLQRTGHRDEAGIFVGGSQPRQRARRRLGLLSQLGHLLRQRHQSRMRPKCPAEKEEVGHLWVGERFKECNRPCGRAAGEERYVHHEHLPTLSLLIIPSTVNLINIHLAPGKIRGGRKRELA